MAILPDAQDAVAVTLVGTYNGHLWNNKIHFHSEVPLGTVTSTHLSTFNDSIAAAWGTNIAPLCNPLVLLTDVNSMLLTSRTSPTFYSHLVTPTPGTRTGTPNPANTAVCISWHINRRYRGGHGRIYVPAGNIADVTTGATLAGAFQTAANSAAAAFYTQLEGLSLNAVAMNLVVLSYYERAPDPANPGEFISVLRTVPQAFPVVSAKVRTRFDTQRRRLGKELS